MEPNIPPAVGEAPEFLFHYTSVGTAEKIVRGRELWGTNIYYLNDGSEFDHGIKLMRSHLKQLAKNDENARAFLEAVEWPAFDSPTVSVFVISFSEIGDLLSQWRSYCPPNRGISLGFESAELIRAAGSQNFELTQCSYEPHSQETAVAAMAAQYVQEFNGTGSDAEKTSVIGKFVKAFARMAASFKHASFAEEREWRLFCVSDDGSCQPLYREGLSTLVPYIIFRLPTDTKDRLRIRRIVIGPTPHAYLARAAVSEMVKRNSVLYGQVSPSQTPFRAW